MKEGKYILLYSEKSLERAGANKAINNDGNEVEYTCLGDVGENWKEYYLWDDTIIVGFVDKLDQITHCAPRVDLLTLF